MITVGIEKWPKTRGTIANRSTRLKRPSWNRFPAITYTCLIFRFSRGKKGGRVCGKDPTPFSPGRSAPKYNSPNYNSGPLSTFVKPLRRFLRNEGTR